MFKSLGCLIGGIFAGAVAMAPTKRVSQRARWINWSWANSGVVVSLLILMVQLTAAAGSGLGRGAIPRLADPPGGTLIEACGLSATDPTVDHSMFDGLLRRHVSSDGGIDYPALMKDAGKLDEYIASLAEAPLDALDRNEKLTLLINAYNAFTLRLILDYYPVSSIKDIPAAKRWADKRWRLGPHTWSLDQIEHDQIRPNFGDPRVHFALVCAAVGCPRLRNEAYRPDHVEQQLEDQARYVHRHERWFRFDAGKGIVYLTRLYKWYGGDFEQVAGTVLDYAARYSPPLKQALAAGRKPGIRWLDYNWTLNSKKRTP